MSFKNISVPVGIFAGAGFIAFQAVLLFLFGQPAICECGYVKFWEGVVLSSGNSQHLTDWYTFSHIIHGFAFYWLSGILFPGASIGARFAFAIGLEAMWETAENTPKIIDHYRQQALAQGYIGDSIINSVFDTLAAALGFVMARKLPIFAIIALAAAMELFTVFMIRDSLLLNIIGFFYQFEFISNWQSGG